MLNMMILVLGLLSASAGYTPATADSVPQPSVKLAQSPPSFLGLLPGDRGAIYPMGQFYSMGDVALYDDRDSVVGKKGPPLSVTKDAYTGYTEYRYEDITVGLYEGMVYYVHADVDMNASASPGKIKLNGKWLFLESGGLALALGQPDFEAEDGDVYIRDLAAIKIYRDPETRTIVGVDLFDTIAF